jgi:hypothetical protein
MAGDAVAHRLAHQAENLARPSAGSSGGRDLVKPLACTRAISNEDAREPPG